MSEVLYELERLMGRTLSRWRGTLKCVEDSHLKGKLLGIRLKNQGSNVECRCV